MMVSAPNDIDQIAVGGRARPVACGSCRAADELVVEAKEPQLCSCRLLVSGCGEKEVVRGEKDARACQGPGTSRSARSCWANGLEWNHDPLRRGAVAKHAQL